MQKWMCLGSMIVAGLVLILCALDLVIGVPFSGEGFGAFLLPDIGGIIASAVLLYLAFDAFKDVK
ncbi:MAG: hypothetical protein R3B84_19015 [Zavarzinella sp.]